MRAWWHSLAVTSLSAILFGCGGGDAAHTGPPTIATFTADPGSITSGQSSTLTWSVSDATAVSISGIGTVNGSSIQVKPDADTDYVLTATNEAGTAQARTSITIYPQPNVWFAPEINNVDPNYGSVDYFALFSETAPWSTAASHIHVFKLYAGILDLEDAVLVRLFEDLKRRHIAVAIEFGPLTSKECGIGVEGFDGSKALHFAKRIRDLGGTLQYVAFDEPFFFGSLYTGPSACRWTADQVAENAAASVAEIKSVFPHVVVGDIEVMPVTFADPDWLDRYQAWMDAWERATGAPLAFFHCDVDTASDWMASLEAVRRITQQRHIAFGLIYTGTFLPATDAEWVSEVESYFTGYEKLGGPVPDQVIFQSWQPFPKHILPETDPTTFTNVINRYFRERTTLTSTVDASSIRGNLSARDSGISVANVPIVVTAAPRTGSGKADTYIRTGTFPAGTEYITFAIRVNGECGLPGPAEFYVSRFTLDAGGYGTLNADFTNELNGWGWRGDASVFEVKDSTLHVLMNAGEVLGMEYQPLPLSVAGTPFTFSVNATIPPGSRGNGCLILVFQRTSLSELGRVSIPLRPQPMLMGTTQTAADGGFGLALRPMESNDYVLWAEYAGSDTLWPAASSHLLGSALDLNIATESLPSGSTGVAYSQTMAVEGGVGPYIWVASGLPPGLTLGGNGALTGIPTMADEYSASVTVLDDSMPTQASEQSFSLEIR